MQDVLIIGAGPAGISAALYAARAGRSVTVLYKGVGSLEKAERIENYYGLPQPVTGTQLAQQGMAQAAALGVSLVRTEALGVSWDGTFTVETQAGAFTAPALLLATGAGRKSPPVPGVAQLEGHGVSYCATCDAIFYRGKDVAVLGAGEYALHEAAYLAQVAGSVTLLTNGAPAPANLPEKVTARTEQVTRILGTESVTGVQLAEGEPVACAGVFIALGVAGSGEIARKLGAETEGGRIVTDADMATNLPGLYAAGDCVGGLLQVAKAVSDGAKAGLAMTKYLRTL